jgi:hypothetical protein
MSDYRETPILLDTRLALALAIQAPTERIVDSGQTSRHLRTSLEEVAAALADFAGLRRPTTPQGIEMLCELVLLIQDHGMLKSTRTDPVYIIGGTMDMGWPIDRVDRLTGADCFRGWRSATGRCRAGKAGKSPAIGHLAVLELPGQAGDETEVVDDPVGGVMTGFAEVPASVTLSVLPADLFDLLTATPGVVSSR